MLRSHSRRSPRSLSVSQIETVSEYRERALSRIWAPCSRVLQGEAAEWASERLTASGGLVEAVLVIEEASIVFEPLKQEEGLTAVFKTQQAERYTRIRARLDIRVPAVSEWDDSRLRAAFKHAA